MLKILNTILLAVLISVAAMAQTASFDNAFGVKGIKTLRGEAVSIFGEMQVDIANDGKVVFLENANSSLDTPAYFIKKLLANGSTDLTFGTQGKIRVQSNSFGLGSFLITDLKVLSDSKILLSGTSAATSSDIGKLTLVRLNSNGTIDNTFGNKGVALLSDPTETLFGYKMKIQADGKILVATFKGDLNIFLITRFTSSGILDNSFGTKGMAELKLSDALIESVFVGAIETDNQGNIYALGRYGDSFNFETVVAVCKFNSSGAIVSSFGKSGLAKVSSNSEYSDIVSLGIQTDGKIVVATRVGDIFEDEVKENNVYRLTTSGILDASFGTNGKVEFFTYKDTQPIYKAMVGMKLMFGNNKILIGTFGYDEEKEDSFISFARLNANGTKDATFGVSGELFNRVDTLEYSTGSLAIQSNTNNLIMFNQAENLDGFSILQFSKLLNPFGVSAKEMTEVQGVNVFPTIVSSELTLEAEFSKESTFSVDVIDAQGRVVTNLKNAQHQHIGKYQETFHLSNTLSSGVYFVAISNENGVISKKIVKQ
jgi:uncharacterized delta-60 repeat protein